jgi:DNA-binding NtrC family response regulator
VGAAEEAAPLPEGIETILYVDDEPALAELGLKMLGKLGYRVDSFTRGVQALTAFRQNPGRYDLVVTDQSMPAFTGLDLARAVHEVRPDLPVLLSTGYSDQVNSDNAADLGLAGFLAKPVAMADLARAVRRVLDDRKGRRGSNGE